MPVAIGSRLGPYEIVSAIGAGGMGEVYRARDTKLGRDVAIKVLPDVFARDADRMARFQREAKVLASLNHPNIATVHGLEDSGNTCALVMELAEGPTLADRIRQGPIPIDEALPIARQMADALEYAHEKGIIHRDLKPANIKVAADDTLKILDFGLAKAMEEDSMSVDISTSPTLSRLATMQGVLLGTAAYMSPEQAKGKTVDRRTDIWAFGCVLYEMLTGKMAFSGEAVTGTLAAVIRGEPDWSQLPTATPMRVRVLLQRCLQKDPKQRLRDIGDARISLDEVLYGAADPAPAVSPQAAVPLWRRTLPWVTGLLIAAIASLATWNLRPAPARPVTRTVITLPPGQQLAGFDQPVLALSADGSQLAYVATTQAGKQQIYLRALDSLEARPVPGTEGASGPFFSPDGQWLAFFADGKLKKVSVSGGAPEILASGAALPRGASWSTKGNIVFAPGGSTVLRQVSDTGGNPEQLTRFGKGESNHRWPEFLPGGKALLFNSGGGGAVGNWQIVVQSLSNGEKRNVAEGPQPRYAPPGHLIYGQAGNLMAVPFDGKRLEVTGAAVPVVEGVRQTPGTGAVQFSASATGSLAYIPGGVQSDSQRKLVWVNRNGREQPLAAPPQNYSFPRISPDGRRLAMGISGNEGPQLWLYDLARDTLSRLTFEGSTNNFPVWTPDDRRIAFVSNREGPLNIFWQLADGSGGLERLTTNETVQVPISWSSDGQLLTLVGRAPETGDDIWVLRLSDRKTQPFLQTPFNEAAPQFSPDRHWLAYASNESSRYEVYVQPYPGPGGKYQISTDGGTEPVWDHSGRELFYRSGDKMMAVDIATQPAFVAGKPHVLFQGPYVANVGPQICPYYDVSRDGQRFLMVQSAEQQQTGTAPTQIIVVQNWTEELKRLVPTRK
jgi:eukaryotic-like serine/threonine-protein kinase